MSVCVCVCVQRFHLHTYGETLEEAEPHAATCWTAVVLWEVSHGEGTKQEKRKKESKRSRRRSFQCCYRGSREPSGGVPVTETLQLGEFIDLLTWSGRLGSSGPESLWVQASPGVKTPTQTLTDFGPKWAKINHTHPFWQPPIGKGFPVDLRLPGGKTTANRLRGSAGIISGRQSHLKLVSPHKE